MTLRDPTSATLSSQLPLSRVPCPEEVRSGESVVDLATSKACNMSDSTTAVNVWGVIAGVFGTVALGPMIVNWFINRLPSAKLPALVALMESTQELFLQVIRDGSLTDENEIYQCYLNLFSIKIRIGDMGADNDEATLWQQDVRNWCKGLSGKIRDLSNQLSTIRARLSRAQSARSKHLAATGQTNNFVPSLAAQQYLLHYASFTSPPPPPMVVQDTPPIASDDGSLTSSAGVVPAVPTLTPCPVHSCVQALSNPTAVAPPDLPTGPPCTSSDSKPPRVTTSIPEEPMTTHYIISDADVKSLLSVRRVPPQPRIGVRRQRASRRAVLIQLSRKLFGPDTQLGRRSEVNLPREKTTGSRLPKVTVGAPHAYPGLPGTCALDSSDNVDLEAQVHSLDVDVDCASDSDSGEWSYV
ncbi:hypothetical protein VTO73DRAFT_2240 [Trametes versicolor]